MTDTEWKTCARCEDECPTTEFWADKSKLDGLHGYCKECSREVSRVWMAMSRKAEPARWAAQQRRDHRAREAKKRHDAIVGNT